MAKMRSVKDAQPIQQDDEFFWWKIGWRLFKFSVMVAWRIKYLLVVGFILLATYSVSGWLTLLPILIFFVTPLVITILQKFGIGADLLVLNTVKKITTFYLGDFRKMKEMREGGKALNAGNELFRQLGLIDFDDPNVYSIELYTNNPDYDELLTSDVAVSPVRVKETLDEYASALGYHSVSTPEFGGGNNVAYKLFRCDPLADGYEITNINDVAVDLENGSFGACLNQDGTTENISFKNVSGLLVAGMSGSGKSMSLLSGLFPFLYKGVNSGLVDLWCADGKGGFDLTWMKGLVNEKQLSIAEPSMVELDEMVEITTIFKDEMMRRYARANELQAANAWDLPADEFPLQVLLIDECQTYLDVSQYAGNKEAQEKVNIINGNLTMLLKRSRAVKQTVILITQKSDSKAIPTSIRDICQLRIAFRQPNRMGSEMILGTLPDDLPITPHQLPKMPGYALITNEASEFKMVRFGFISDETRKQWKLKADEVVNNV